MQDQLHDHTARLAAAADDLHSQMAAVQASVGLAAATAGAELAAARSELQGCIDTQAVASKGLAKELEVVKKASSAAADAAAAAAALAAWVQEQAANAETQIAALRADLNASVTNAKLEEELQFLSLHDQVRV
jgi:serine protease inhibitor